MPMHPSNPKAKFAVDPSRPSPHLGALASLVAFGTVSLATVSAHADDAPVPPPPAIVEPAPSPTTATTTITPAAPAEPPTDRDFWQRNTAGYLGGQFYLRSEDSAFILYPQARLQMDAYG